MKCFTKMTCIDRLGRSVRVLPNLVKREQVAQCGPSEFVVSHYVTEREPEMSVYDSDLHCLHHIRCVKCFSDICCNSKFVFGLWDTGDSYEPNKEDGYATLRIQVLYLHTLSEAFGLRVPRKYAIERIMADEHHVVAMSFAYESGRRESFQWFMSVFDLQAIGNESSRVETGRFFQAERHIDLAMPSVWLSEVFLLDGWLVVPSEDDKKLFWFDKDGQQSETSTEWDTGELRAIYSSGCSLLFALDDTLLLKLV